MGSLCDLATPLTLSRTIQSLSEKASHFLIWFSMLCDDDVLKKNTKPKNPKAKQKK